MPQPEKLPTVVASSVVRSAHRGESHGGLYLVDLETGTHERILDWDDPAISWAGRGLDRGLRGIAFHAGLVYLAAADEILVYTKNFEKVGAIRNRYLGHCHEMHVARDTLYVTSTGFDSILQYDLASDAFVRGYHLRLGRLARLARRALGGVRPPIPRVRVFGPNSGFGPEPGDTCHLNNVFHEGGTLFVSGTGLGHVLAVRDSEVSSYARIPYGAHNARPFEGGVLLNDTRRDSVRYLDRRGGEISSLPVARYDEGALLNAHLPGDHARQAFGRGLCVAEGGVVVAGSSPATVSAYDLLEDREILKTVNLTMDVRNAIHGLEVWPFRP